MNKKLLEKLKSQLEEGKTSIKKELQKFAKKDKKIPDDWDTLFPHWDHEAGGAGLEIAADEVEEYNTLLPIEHVLEIRLKNINLALEKIKKKKYGKCEKCGKVIPGARLKISPEARFCLKCQRK